MIGTCEPLSQAKSIGRCAFGHGRQEIRHAGFDLFLLKRVLVMAALQHESFTHVSKVAHDHGVDLAFVCCSDLCFGSAFFGCELLVGLIDVIEIMVEQRLRLLRGAFIRSDGE